MTPPSALLIEILETIAAIPSEEHRRRALRGAAPVLDAPNLLAAAGMARRLADPFCRAQSLAALALRLNTAFGDQPVDPTPVAALHEALDAIRQVPDPERRAVVLIHLAAVCDDLGEPGVNAIAREALESIVQAGPGEMQVRWLAALPPDLDEDVAIRIEALPEPWQRALAWVELASARPGSGDDLLLHAAQAYQEIPGLAERLLVAPLMFAMLPDDDRDDLLRELVLECCHPLTASTTAFPGATLNGSPLEIGAIAGGDGADPARPPAPEAQLAVDSVAIYNLLDGALEFLPDDLLPHALALAQRIHEPSHRMDALARLAGRLDEAQRRALAGEAFDFLTALDDEFGLAFGLGGLARFCPPERMPDLAQVAGRIGDPWARAEALSALARRMPDQRAALLEKALSAARSEASPWKRARALTIVAGRWD